MNDKETKKEVRQTAREVYQAFTLDEWPGAAAITDFGLRSTKHYGALQYAVKHEGVTVEQLDEALGSGPRLQALISKVNPYRDVVFETEWDDLPESFDDEDEAE